MKIGIIGVGRMGTPMARRLIAKGHVVTVLDRNAQACEALARDGASIAATPAAVAATCEIVLTSLPGPQEVEETMLGPAGILENIRPDATVLATSTVDAEQSRRHAGLLRARNAHHLDAPVSGGVEGAVAGTLAVMVGGEKETFARARPILECIGSEVRYFGPAGAGNDMKLIIQMIFGSYLGVFLEAVAFGEALGIRVDEMLATIAGSSAHHPSIGKRYDKIIANDTSPRSPVSLFEKDLSLVRRRLQSAQFDAPIATAAADLFSRAKAAGLGGLDVTALRRMYERER
jgi:3-hydroxyisobutyrate dehydrogenase-like beta-hydroxyacid dehydrogenase